MLKTIWSGAISLLFLAGSAEAACPTFPYTFMTGATAVASQVNSNFTNVITCFAPLANPSFTGKVGIGTTTPAQALDVNGTIQLDGSRFFTGVDGANNFWMGNNQGTAPGNLSVGYQTNGSGTVTAVSMLTQGVNRVYVSSNGNVGIATTAPSYTLHVNGSVAGTSAYNNLSDARLKKNIGEIAGGLAIVEKLRGVRFRWRKPDERSIGKALDLPVDAPQVGFVAQEVAAVLPEAVTSAKDGTLSMAETRVVPVLVEAVKEQQAEIGGLTAAVHRLLAANEALKQRVDELDGTPGGAPAQHASRN